MITKTQVLKTLQDLPEEFMPDELIDKILLVYEIQKAISESNSQKLIPHEEVVNKLLNNAKKG